MRLLAPVIAFWLAVPHFAAASEIRLTHNGIEIDAGSMGQFTLDYPHLLDASQQQNHKLLEANTAEKTATLKYDGDNQLDLALGPGGKLAVKFVRTAPDVKSVSFDLQIPIAYNQGGKWKIGDKSDSFPKEKPAKPHLFQGDASALQLTNFEGKTLTLTAPQYSFLQLSDNREWGWAIYYFKAFTPKNPDTSEMTLGIEVQAGAEGKVRPLVDELGQSARDEWPDKVKSVEELKADVEAEKTYYASLQPPKLDAFGGLPGSKEKLELQATGFFHVEQKGKRWFLVDPAGNAFFHLGLCSVCPSEDYTVVKGRESAFAWIPPRNGEFQSAYRGDSGEVVSFHLANMIRKYGEPYSTDSYTARMIERMRKWGFNSIGAFSSASGRVAHAEQFPTVASLPLAEWEGIPRLPQIGETFDPFDEKTRTQIEANFAKSLPSRANDPLLIGYFIVNEPIYENIPHIVPTLKGDHACKRQLVKTLTEKYKTIGAFNSAWGLHATSFDSLNDTVLAVETDAARADVQAFTGAFLEEMFRFVSETFRKHDKNHLLIGNRLQPGTINNEQLCRIAGKYLDVMSFNYYTYAVDKDFLRRVYDWTGGRPMILSEFFWSASKESGLSGGREVGTQKERGLAYRNYVEQGASLGFVVGIEWFTLIDQAFAGRWFQGFNGERANSGVLAVTDRPWKAMLSEVVKTNYDIYKVWFGEREPFVFEDPRFKMVK